MSAKVIAGPAGHWYALVDDPQFGESLIGLPMLADEDETSPEPSHPADTGDFDGWYEITDPAPDCDDEAIKARLRG